MGVAKPNAAGDAGFSLIEIVIALGLFSLISLAGGVLVSSILQVRDRTEGRLEELGSLQRGLLVLTSDFQQALGGSIHVDATGASLDRPARGGTIAVKYVSNKDKVLRILSINGKAEAQQTLLDQVTAVRWRVFLKNGGWLDSWPREQDTVAPAGAEHESPTALSVEFDLAESRAGVTGTLRRVVELTAPP